VYDLGEPLVMLRLSLSVRVLRVLSEPERSLQALQWLGGYGSVLVGTLMERKVVVRSGSVQDDGSAYQRM